ncbi:hypothetical protein G5B31_19430 [Rhodobacter sp. SGA-6-6]|uniref:hypothetical protein n=1 Tax=Rhodobacter sp. SGA-6-6 TaxID=2710882 RepID=UPI0013E9F0F1|nr:hypothetical protein [Rhodobacter sp. SGA-6-6]NGM47709.1 hypothetical protein [Rhodobacter sp. SGA-6-6]
MSLGLHQRILESLVRQYDAPLIQNNLRGFYVELMVAALLGDGWRHNGSDWGAYDLEHVSGTKIEVKQSAARQTWSGPETVARQPIFSIRTPKIEWVGTVPTPRSARIADAYVFAWHGEHGLAADHRDISQWSFFVVPTHSLPDQRTISLNPLRALAAPVGADHLKHSVEQLFGQGVAA